MIDVLDQERERQQGWADLGLPDPIAVLAEERATAHYLGAPFRSPKRDALDIYFTAHPEVQPPSGW